MAFTEAITGGKAHIVEVAWFCFSRQDATRFFNWHTMLKYFHEENCNACYPRKGWFGLFAIRTALVLIFAIQESVGTDTLLSWTVDTVGTDSLLFRTVLLLTACYSRQCCYWLLAIPYSAATDSSLSLTALLLTPRYPVQCCYWLLHILDSAATDPSLSRTALLLTPPYSGQRWYWLITIPYSAATDSSLFWTALFLTHRYPGHSDCTHRIWKYFVMLKFFPI